MIGIRKGYEMKVVVYGDIGGSGGYHRYCKGLFGTGAWPKDMETWFVCSRSFSEDLGPLDPHIRVIAHPWPGSKCWLFRYLWYLWVYPRIVRKLKPDIEFYTAGQQRVYFRKALTVTTCHNLLLFDEKELDRIEYKDKRRFFKCYRKAQANSFQHSDGTIFLSEFSKHVICKQVLGLKRTTIIPLGLDKDFLLPIKRSYKLGNKINLLYVSPFYTYKHQIEVIQAIQHVRESTRLDVNIRLIGGGDSSSKVQLQKLIHSLHAEDYVKCIDFVPHDTLLQEYMIADICVFASSCETFGISLLEAMGAKLPIACSDRVGLSRILGDAGIYFNPYDPISIANALGKLIENADLRQACGERAGQYVLGYSWQNCAQETASFLEKTLVEEGAMFKEIK